MKFGNLSNAVSKVTGRGGLILKKYSPEILMVVGITGVVGSTILACKATLKVEEVLDEHQEKIDRIASGWEKVMDGDVPAENYTEEAHTRDLTVTYLQTSVEFIKLYGPAVTLGVASIGCVVGAHGIMKKRNVALMAAYKAVEEGFSAYRKRVIEEHGEDIDYMYTNGLRVEEITETETTKSGKTKEVKKQQVVKDSDGLSVYARIFDDGCKQWSKDPSYNLMLLRSQQNYFNDMLKIRGHVFLNEVYDALGIDRTTAGAMVGWCLGNGDDYIDFGLYDENGRNSRFINGTERTPILDFNVDGVIYDMI